MKTVIHVNQFEIKHNNKNPDDRHPVITVKTYKENVYTNSVDIVDDSGNIVATVKYSPDKPLSCGAKVWIETDSNNIRINND